MVSSDKIERVRGKVYSYRCVPCGYCSSELKSIGRETIARRAREELNPFFSLAQHALLLKFRLTCKAFVRLCCIVLAWPRRLQDSCRMEYTIRAQAPLRGTTSMQRGIGENRGLRPSFRVAHFWRDGGQSLMGASKVSHYCVGSCALTANACL